MSYLRFPLALVLPVMSIAMASATEPCPTPTFQPCNSVSAITEVSVKYNDGRPGQAYGTYYLNGEYGSGTTDIIERENWYSVSHVVRSTEYIATTAWANTLNDSMLANASSEADLARGTMRGRIEGYDTVLFPNSLFEVSEARVDLSLRDTINFHLPAYYSGGTAQLTMMVDGAIEDDRPGAFAGTGGTEVYAQLAMGMGGGPIDYNRWNDQQIISDILTIEYNLPETSSNSVDLALGFDAFLRLRSGTGDGSYLIDFDSTAILNLDVPEGITWDSQSGVFLSAVPLPAAVWLFPAGIGLLAAVARRRGADGKLRLHTV